MENFIMNKKATASISMLLVLVLIVSAFGAAVSPFIVASSGVQGNVDEQSPEKAIVMCPTPVGTSLEASKTATGFWQQGVDYSWSIEKSVEPLSSTLDQGTSQDFQYTVDVTRSEQITGEKIGVYGEITVTNTGSVATQDLKIVDTVQYKTGSGQFQDLLQVEVNLGTHTVLQSGETHIYAYEILFTPVSGAIYRNTVKVTITNHAGQMGCAFGPEPKADFCLPSEPSKKTNDASATVTDVFVVPEHYEILGEAPLASWEVTGSNVREYTVTVKNVDAEKDSVSEMINTATVMASDSEKTDMDTATVILTSGGPIFQPEPGLSVEKYGVESAFAGETIEYMVYVNNTGNVDLYGIVLSDDVTGFTDTIDLMVGESWYSEGYIYSYVVPSDFDGTELKNIFTASTSYNDEPIEAMDDWTVIIKHEDKPSITIDKNGPCRAMVGEEVPFEITVTNVGNTPLNNVYVYDTMTDMNYYYDGILLPGEVWKLDTIYCVIDVNFKEMYFVNVAEVFGTFEGGNVWCIDSHAIDIITPSIDVVKTGPDMVFPGETIVWTIDVYNTGDVDLVNVNLHDVITGACQEVKTAVPDGISSDIFIGNLPVGGHVQKTVSMVVPMDWAFDNVCNFVSVKGQPGPSEQWCGGGCGWFDETNERRWVYDRDVKCVFVDKSAIYLEKSLISDPNPRIGDIATFSFTITNTGNTNLEDIVLWDPLLNGDVVWSMDIVDLAIGESATVTADYLVPADTLGSMVNVANVTGYSVIYHVEVNSQAECLFFVAEPSIEIEKSYEPTMVRMGDVIGWSVWVHNNGNVALTDVVVTDPTTGDEVNIGDFAVDESRTYTFNYEVTMATLMDAEFFTWNTAYVDGLYGDIPVSDESTDKVFIATPSMTVEKRGPLSEVCGDEPIVWTVYVNNTGNVPLSNLVIDDELTGDSWEFDSLPVNGKLILTTTAYTPGQVDHVRNVVTVNAQFAVGDVVIEELYGEASDCVTVFYVDIGVTKTGPSVAVRGETITYTITVYNNGNRDMNIHVDDDDISFEADVFVLAHSSEVLTAEYTIPVCYPCGSFTNTVKVGASYNECCDRDCAEWTIEVKELGIRILKTSVESAVPGEYVTYRFDVWNVGGAALSDIVVYDPAIGMEFHIEGVLIPEGSIGANHAVWEYTYQIPVDFLGDSQYGWFDNQAMAYGYYNGVATFWGDSWSMWIHQPECVVPVYQ